MNSPVNDKMTPESREEIEELDRQIEERYGEKLPSK